MKKYQLVKYSNPTPTGGYYTKNMIGGFNTYISALLWKILTGHWKYKIECIEIKIDYT